MEVGQPHVPGAAGIAAAPELGAAGCAAAPEALEPQVGVDESGIVDLPTLAQAYRKVDIGWALSRDQLLRAAEAKLAPRETGEPPRRRSSLVGLAEHFIIYNPALLDHSPVRPIRGNQGDAASTVLPQTTGMHPET